MDILRKGDVMDILGLYRHEINLAVEDLQCQINGLKVKIENINELIKSLHHYRDTTVGLWATDKPEKVQDPEGVMFKLEGHEQGENSK